MVPMAGPRWRRIALAALLLVLVTSSVDRVHAVDQETDHGGNGDCRPGAGQRVKVEFDSSVVEHGRLLCWVAVGYWLLCLAFS